jgi:hypothetical protein
MAVSEDAAALIKKEAVGLLPKGSELEDQLGPILKALGDKPRPTLAVVIPEHHIERAVLRRISDPAVETEIKKALGDCKFKLVDTGRNELSDWAKDMIKGKGGATPSLPQGGDKPWPAALQDADLVVIGEGFSEFAVRTGELVTCTARVEINVIDRKTGKIVLADSRTTRAVDLAEATAGKTALQMAGRQLGVEICRKLVDYQKPEAATTKPAEK